MFTLTGHFNKRSYDEEIIPMKDLLAGLPKEIQDLFASEEKTILFKHAPERIRTDREGQVSHPAGYQVTPVFDGEIGGHQITLRYHTGPRTGSQGQGWKYRPGRIILLRGMLGQPMQINGRKREETLFWLLYPKCANSPFYQPGQAIWYIHDQPAKAATATAANQDKLLDALQMIQQDFLTDPGMQKRLAMGYRNGTRHLGGVTVKSTPDEVKAALGREAQRDPSGFMVRYKDMDSAVIGLVKECAGNAVLSTKDERGSTTWKWSQAEGGGDFYRVPPGMDKWAAIAAHVIANYTSLSPLLEEALKKAKGAKDAPTKEPKSK